MNGKRHDVNNPIVHKVEKYDQIKFKVNRRKEGIKIRAEINGIESWKQWEVNKAKSWFLKRLIKFINILLDRWEK